MFPIGTESQPEKVALMGTVTEAVVGKIGDLIAFQIQDCYGLVRLTFLRAISAVQRRGVAIVWTERNSGGKTIDRANPARGGSI